MQRYLHKPFLIDGLKFDLRIYVLITGTDPLRLYVYEEGLARFATEPYVAPRTDNLEEVCMHLTNYAINKDSPNFIFNESTKGTFPKPLRNECWAQAIAYLCVCLPQRTGI